MATVHFVIPSAIKIVLDKDITQIERLARRVYDPQLKLPGWKLFQRAYINRKIDFMYFFLGTMSQHYYESPRVQDHKRPSV